MIQETAVRNLLIDSLPAKQRSHFLKLCTTVELEFGQLLCETNQRYRYLYFPLTSFISSIAIPESDQPLELGLIGNEGVLGASAVLGVVEAPLRAVVQGSGSALRIPITVFQRNLPLYPKLPTLLNRYIYVSMQQLSQAAICIHYHEIEARLARWLLMTDDRTSENTFLLTHVFLSQMLGVRRSSVSIAANILQEKSLISYARGKIKILDRKGLEAMSCSCYRIMNEFYSRLLGDKR